MRLGSHYVQVLSLLKIGSWKEGWGIKNKKEEFFFPSNALFYSNYTCQFFNTFILHINGDCNSHVKYVGPEWCTRHIYEMKRYLSSSWCQLQVCIDVYEPPFFLWSNNFLLQHWGIDTHIQIVIIYQKSRNLHKNIWYLWMSPKLLYVNGCTKRNKTWGYSSAMQNHPLPHLAKLIFLFFPSQ